MGFRFSGTKTETMKDMHQRQHYWIKMQIIMLKFFVVSDGKSFLGHLMLAAYLEVTELLFEHIQSQENDLLWFQCCRGLEEEDQGYIDRSYGYFDNEGYGTEKTGSTIQKVLLTIFILLNLSVIYTTITHRKKMVLQIL